MPRTARAIEAGLVYHVLNRGNGRMRLFHKDDDYAAFERVLAEGLERYPIDLFTYCVRNKKGHHTSVRHEFCALRIALAPSACLAHFIGYGQEA